MICILYSIFNNNKISWDILLKIKKKCLAPKILAEDEPPGSRLGNLRHLRPLFFAPNINLKPGSKWCRTWETKRSRHRPRAPALGFNMRRRQTIKDVRGIQSEKSFNAIGEKPTLLNYLEYIRKYFPPLTSSSAISF